MSFQERTETLLKPKEDELTDLDEEDIEVNEEYQNDSSNKVVGNIQVLNKSDNPANHFIFSSESVDANERQNLSCYDKLRDSYDYFRPIAPQISARSLNQNINILTSKHKKDEKANLMSMWSAGFTIINLYLGLGLLSYPYALKQGGFIAYILLAFMCWFMSYTGKLLVRCFNKMKSSKKTYQDVGYYAFGKYGSLLISVGIIFEFFGGVCTNLIFMWDNVHYFISSLKDNDDNDDSGNYDASLNKNISLTTISIICSVCVLPTCWILNLSELSFVSFLGCICKAFIVFVVIFNLFLHPNAVSHNIANNEYSTFPNDTSSLSICCGIFILSFSGHPVLPAVYSAMKEPQKFELLLDRCFVIMFVIYSVMSLCGYLQFANDTNVIITYNLIMNKNVNDNGNNNDGFTVFISQILLMLVICSLYFQISPLLSCLVEIPEMTYNKFIDNNFKQRIFRTLSFLICCIASWIIINNLAVLEAITGSICTMITSVICPSLFYFAIYKKHTTFNQRVLLMIFVFVGFLFGLFLLFNDIKSLI